MGNMTIGHLSAGLFASMLLLEALSAAPAEAMSMEEDGCRNDRTPAIAIVYCTRLIQSSQHAGAELAWAYANRGWAYGEEGKDDLAMADFETALRLKPDEDLAFYRRGNLYLAVGKPEQAAAIRQPPQLAHPFARDRRMRVGDGIVHRPIIAKLPLPARPGCVI